MRSLLYSDDSNSSTLITTIVRAAEVPRQEIARLVGNTKEFRVQLCTQIPSGINDSFCTIAFDSCQPNASLPIPAGFRRTVCCFIFIFSTSLICKYVLINVCPLQQLLRRSSMEPSWNTSGLCCPSLICFCYNECFSRGNERHQYCAEQWDNCIHQRSMYSRSCVP
jgi:hypothetical protein